MEGEGGRERRTERERERERNRELYSCTIITCTNDISQHVLVFNVQKMWRRSTILRVLNDEIMSNCCLFSATQVNNDQSKRCPACTNITS